MTLSTLIEGEPPPPPPPPPPPGSLTASFTYSCGSLTCGFDGGGSTGATGYAWTFCDGGTGSGETTNHTYDEDVTTYTVKLTVTDGSTEDEASQTIQCKARGRNGVACR